MKEQELAKAGFGSSTTLHLDEISMKKGYGQFEIIVYTPAVRKARPQATPDFYLDFSFKNQFIKAHGVGSPIYDMFEPMIHDSPNARVVEIDLTQLKHLPN